MSDEDAVMGAFARFLAVHKQQQPLLQQQQHDSYQTSYDPVQMLTKTVAQLERRLDLVERMFALQQQTNDALLRVTASAQPQLHQSVPKKNTARAVDEPYNHHNVADDVRYDENEVDDDDNSDVVIRRIIVTPPPPPHAMLMVNERCRRAAG